MIARHDRSTPQEAGVRKARLAGYVLKLTLAASVFTTSTLSLSYRFGLHLPCGGVGDCNALRYHPLNDHAIVKLPELGLVVTLLLTLTYLRSLSIPESRALGCQKWIALLSALANTLLVMHASVDANILCTWCVASAILYWIIVGATAIIAEQPVLFTVSSANRAKMTVIALSLLAFVLSGTVHQISVYESELPNTIMVDNLEALTDGAVMTRERLVLGTGINSSRLLIFFDPFCPTCRDLMLSIEKGWDRRKDVDVYLVFAALHGTKGNLIACATLELARRENAFWSVIAETGNGAKITENDFMKSLFKLTGESGVDVQSRLGDGTHEVYQLIARDERVYVAVNLSASPIIVEWPRESRPHRLRIDAFHLKYGVRF